jgi:hypothetical protein
MHSKLLNQEDYLKSAIITLLAVSLIGCGSENDSNELPAENVIVYIHDGSTQCNDDGIKPTDSAKTLIDTGIDVLSTFCGSTTGLAVITLCGAQTTSIIAHEIRKVNLTDANDVGYKDIESLVDVELQLGYEIMNCSNEIRN